MRLRKFGWKRRSVARITPVSWKTPRSSWGSSSSPSVVESETRTRIIIEPMITTPKNVPTPDLTRSDRSTFDHTPFKVFSSSQR